MECVTVLLATYNQESYIYQAIDSVLVQSYGKIQLIIVDDCSEYFNVIEIKSYVEKNKKENIIKLNVIKNEKNLGTVRSLNNARKYVEGKYLVPLAGDDCFYNECTISNYVMSFEKQNSDVGILISQVLHCDNKMERVLYECVTEKQIEIINENNNQKLYGYLCMDCFFPAIGIAFDMTVVMKYGLYDERCYLVEDWPYYLRLIRLGVHARFENFISAKHRDGGVSHSNKDRKSERNDMFHSDLISIMKYEILENYTFAPKDMQRDIYIYANDRVVISEFRKDFLAMKLSDKLKWLFKHYYFPGVIFRGVIRRLKNENMH